MPLPARPLPLTLATLALLVVVLAASLALGADALSLVVGAAAVAITFALVVVLWLVPAQRAARRRHRRERKAARRARAKARKAEEERAAEQAAAMRRLLRDSERRLLVRLESREWLTRELGLPRPLPPTRAYAASPDLLVELVQAIDRTAPEHVVELGGGISSIVIARRLGQLGRGHLTTLEHLPGYAEATRVELAAYGLTERARVIDAPLIDVQLDSEVWPWYELGPDVPERIDLLVVDGPPGTTRPQARYPALPLLRARLAPGALVLLDDSDRPEERAIVRRWLDEVDGLEETPMAIARGATLLVYRG